MLDAILMLLGIGAVALLLIAFWGCIGMCKRVGALYGQPECHTGPRTKAAAEVHFAAAPRRAKNPGESSRGNMKPAPVAGA